MLRSHQDGSVVTVGVKRLRHSWRQMPPSRGNVGSSGHTLLSVYRVTHGNYSTFRGFMQMPCSLRLWKTPGFRHHGRYGLGRVDVSVYSAMLGFRLYMLCVILRSSTWTADRAVLFLRPLVLAVTWSCCSPVKYRITDFSRR